MALHTSLRRGPGRVAAETLAVIITGFALAVAMTWPAMRSPARFPCGSSSCGSTRSRP